MSDLENKIEKECPFKNVFFCEHKSAKEYAEKRSWIYSEQFCPFQSPYGNSSVLCGENEKCRYAIPIVVEINPLTTEYHYKKDEDK